MEGNFKIFPSGAAVKPERITGFDLVDINDKIRVLAITEERTYFADSFDDRLDAENYIIDLVKELDGVANVKVKNYDDGIITTGENYDLLNVEIGTPVIVDSIEALYIERLIVDSIEALYIERLINKILVVVGDKVKKVKEFKTRDEAKTYLVNLINRLDGDWINIGDQYYLNPDKVVNIDVNKNVSGFYEVTAELEGGCVLPVATKASAEDAICARDDLKERKKKALDESKAD